jgi:hypothetical protein
MQTIHTHPWRQFIIGMTLYGILVILQGLILVPNQFPLPVMIPLALAPLIPAIWAMSGWLMAVRRFDELQQNIQREAGLFALAATALLTFSYGFLETYLQLPRISMFFVFPLISGSYMAGYWLACRRYQ